MEELGQPSREYNHLTHLSLLVNKVHLFPKFYLPSENGDKSIKDLSLLPVWELFTEQSEILIAMLKPLKTITTNTLSLSPSRIPHLARDISKVLDLLIHNPGIIPILLSPFQTTKVQEMLNLDYKNSSSDLGNLTNFQSRTFPEVVLNDIITVLSPNKFPIIADEDFKPYVLIDYNNSQILPSGDNPNFIDCIRANFRDHLIMGNVCLSNSIANFHFQIINGKPPLTQQEIVDRYPGSKPIFYDIKNDAGWQNFLETWRLLNFKQVASSCLITQEGTAVFFTQNFEDNPITRKTQNWKEINSDDQAKQNFLRMVFTLIKVGGYEIYSWLKNHQIIDKSVLVPNQAITAELMAAWMGKIVSPLDQKNLEIIKCLPTEDVLELIDTSSFTSSNCDLYQDLQIRQSVFFQRL